MITNEGELAKNVQTVRDDCDFNMTLDPCRTALNEIMDFMKQDGPLQDQLRSNDKMKMDGNSLIMNPNIYPSEKSENK